MATPRGTENTHFSHDILGRYVCNTFDEAQLSTDKGARPDARAIDATFSFKQLRFKFVPNG